MESMARGFESKDVEFQQAEAERAKTFGRDLSVEERDRRSRRQTIELALAKARADLSGARTPAHKKTLTDAITALQQQLSALAGLLLVAMLLGVAACGPRSEEASLAQRSADPSAGASAKAEASRSSGPVEASRAPEASRSTAWTPERDGFSRAKTSGPRIVFLGDSLTAGLGLAIADAYPSVIQERLKAAGLNYEVVNAGVSGDTSAGGLARLDWAVQGDVRVLVVALGGNDALRALPAEQLQQNLAQIIER